METFVPKILCLAEPSSSPSPSTGFVLQQNTDLNPANWTTPSETITDNGTISFISVTPAPGNRFCRLFKR